MKENGKTITCMAKEFILGLMVENMRGTMLMIKSMDSEYIGGLTVVNMLAFGKKASSMARAITHSQMVNKGKESGKKERGSDGKRHPANNNDNFLLLINMHLN